MIIYEKELNAEQLAAVTGGDGPCVVLAGAGSGKTRTIVYRVAWLIEHGVRPERILLLTFTNKAANEMLSRIAELIGAAGVMGGTFHSVANRLLRAYSNDLGFTPGFTILDEDDAKALVKVSLRELGYESDGKKFPSPAVIKELMSYAANAAVSLENAIERKHPRFLPLLPELTRIAAAYDEKKRRANAMDFDDLLVHFRALLAKNPAARERIAGRFDFILVDEYQDTNPLQAAIVGLLANDRKNVLVVGDDAQSIYSFRAADVKNILDFPKQFPGAKIFRLQTNYRSTPEILSLANDVIARNASQYPKELRSVAANHQKPVVVPLPSAGQEAAFVAKRIRRLIDEGTAPKEIAALFRATFHSQALEFELMKLGIEYEYRGGVKFFDRAHVKDALAFLRIAANFGDEAAWLRVLWLQPGVGDVMAGRIFSMMREAGSLAKAVLAPVAETLGSRAERGWRELQGLLEAIRAAGEKPSELVRVVLDSSYVDYLENEYPNFRERLEDIEQLATFAEDYEKVGDLLAEVTLDESSFQSAARTRTAGSKVVLSTIHQAKGLEWDTVFMIHLTNSAFPNRRAMMEEGGLEEERRLFYVAVTRAKRHLYLCYPATIGRDQFGNEQPSCFLEECDPSCLDLGLVNGDWGSTAKDDAGNFYEEETVAADGDPFSGMKTRMQTVRKDWKKKSFLRDV